LLGASKAQVLRACRHPARGKTKPVISPIAFQAVQKIDAIFMLHAT
jgi:hypothetical protein